MDQLALAFIPPGIGHNQPPERIDPIEGLIARLKSSDADFVARFRDELACTRVRVPIASEADARTATDFVARCQVHIRRAEAAYKQEKVRFLAAGRTVDSFFKRRGDMLTVLLAPVEALLPEQA